MTAMRAFLCRLRDLFRRRAIAREFEEEMAAHVADLEAELVRRGASPAEARDAAAREFGNVLRVREDLRAQAGFPRWDELAGDLRNAGRNLRRRPGFAVTVIGILALGLGAAAVIHGLLDAIYLRPLPVPRPQELYAVVNADPDAPSRLGRGTVRRLEELLPPHSVAAYAGGGSCIVRIGSQTAERFSARLVNGDFFAALGIAPAAGRLLGPPDDVPGKPAPVVVVSAAWAIKNFGSPAAAVGREIVVNRVPMTIVGVLPAAFRDLTIGRRTELWLATALQPSLRYDGNSSESVGDDRPNDPDWNREERISWLEVLIRVRSDPVAVRLAVQQAWAAQRDDLLRVDTDPRYRERLNHRMWRLLPAPGGPSGFRARFHSTAWLFAGVVAVMLVLVCVNVSGLLLVRSMSRHREIGVRLAIGAGSFRVMRLCFLEGLLLSAAGGLCGWLLAKALLPVAVGLLAPGQDLAVALGGQSMLLMGALVVVTAVLSTLAPALWISRIQPLPALSGSQGLGQAPVRLSRLLVIAQFALAVALVTVAASLGKELQQAFASDPGLVRDRVVSATFDPASNGYADAEVPALLERLRTTALGVPGVKAASFAACGILAGSESTSGIHVRGPQARVEQGTYQHDSIEPGYLGAVGLPVLAGRDFVAADRAGQPPVALVSASFAREIFGDTDPVGRVFGYDTEPSAKDWTVVGVVPDVHMNGVRRPAPPMFYLALGQVEPSAHFMAVRFDGRAAGVLPTLRAALARGEPGLVFGTWKTFEQRMTDDLSGDFATAHLAEVFGACAVLLAGAGVAASLGYLVVLRQRELALRLAIGAAPGQVLRGILKDALRTCAWGGSLGLAAVWLAPQLPVVGSVLHGRPGVMPALVAAAVALVAALIAAWLPARRAARIDPVLMLKLQ